MSTLASELRPAGADLPAVALLQTALAPVVCVGMLGAAMLAHGEPFAARYSGLALIAFFLSLQVFGALPLANGAGPRPLFGPASRLAVRWAAVVGILLFLGFLTKLSGLYSRKVMLTWFALTPFALHIAQEFACRLLPRLAIGAARTRVIVGANGLAHELARRIAEDPCLGEVKGFFDDAAPGQERASGRLPLLGGLQDVPDYVKRHGVNLVYIALPTTADPKVRRLLERLRDTTASVYFVPDTLAVDLIQPRIESIGGIPAIALCETPLYGVNVAIKRGMDLAIASAALVLVLPLMAAIAAAVKLGSPGPVLFKQRRYGLDGREIVVYKFRSMTVCEDGARLAQAKRGDARVTAFGALLRRFSLDELPQFINVLEGTMSLVGPRPHAVAHNEQYRRLIRGYMVRHKVKPGITGWAQVNGLRGETDGVDKMRRRIEFDLDYLRHWSLPLDLWILFRTAFVVLKDPNAY